MLEVSGLGFPAPCWTAVTVWKLRSNLATGARTARRDLETRRLEPVGLGLTAQAFRSVVLLQNRLLYSIW